MRKDATRCSQGIRDVASLCERFQDDRHSSVIVCCAPGFLWRLLAFAVFLIKAKQGW